jgi:hypothetical protein
MLRYRLSLNTWVWYFESVCVLLLLMCLPAASPAADTADLLTPPPRVLLLDNCDSDFRAPPFNDKVLFIDSKGELITHIGGLNVCQNIGGNRAISVSEDGRYFVVCENVANKITAYDLKTGDELWSLSGKFTSAAIAQNVTYVLASDYKTYGDVILTIDVDGNIIKHSKEAEGFDIVVDADANCLWVVGGDIKKCDMELEILKTIDPVAWYAVSVDVGSDGSAWVAERTHQEVGGSRNRLLNISPECELLQSIPLKDLSTRCLRVNRYDGCVWITGKRGSYKRSLVLNKWPPTWEKTYQLIGPETHRYSSEGKLLLKIKRGGHTIDIDSSDGSVWIAGQKSLLHYSSEGKKLHTFDNVSNDQKWITIVK